MLLSGRSQFTGDQMIDKLPVASLIGRRVLIKELKIRDPANGALVDLSQIGEVAAVYIVVDQGFHL
jgi:hypothetical protein